MRRARRFKNGAIAIALCVIFGGCGQTGRDTSTETNWLSQCVGDSDCRGLACVCGVCSQPCSSLRDCTKTPAATRCSAPDDPSECVAEVLTICLPDRALSEVNEPGGATSSDDPDAANGGSAASSDPDVGSGGSAAGTSDGTTGTSTVERCNLPVPPPVENPTAEALERDRVSQELCEKLASLDCLPSGGTSFISDQTTTCSLDDRIKACAMDRASEYEQVPPECRSNWVDVVNCALGASYDRMTCRLAEPSSLGGDDDPCGAEKEVLWACVDESVEQHRVDGTRTSCHYGPGVFTDCDVECEDVDGRNFGMECFGPEGLPLRCSCYTNGILVDEDNFGDTDVMYASDCLDAATQAANGRCTARLDCCLDLGARFNNECVCGDPVLANLDSCADATTRYAGDTAVVVDMCPQYLQP